MLGCSSRDQNKRVCVFFLGGNSAVFVFGLGVWGLLMYICSFWFFSVLFRCLGFFTCIV